MNISLEQAQAMIERARAHAERLGVPMNIAVVAVGMVSLLALGRGTAHAKESETPPDLSGTWSLNESKSQTLQQKMAVSALVGMNERAFHTLQVRAKERMCANDRILCHEEFCRFAKDYPEKMERSNLLGRLRDGYSHLDPDVVFEEARHEEVCPFEVQLELAHRADAIVADYNYVFEPAAAMRHLTGEDLREAILLIDEAHNLPDRARQIFSPELLDEEPVVDVLLADTEAAVVPTPHV